MQNEARILNLIDLFNTPPEATLFLETKQTLRPAFFMGVIDRERYGIKNEYRYAVHMMTASKLVKYWEMRLYNKTWRLWRERPSREQRVEVKWE